MPKKRTRVPEVLWRLFGSRARTLSNTIVSLHPSPTPTPSSSNADGMSFLLRPGDSSDYRKLLDRCFVVISENATKNTISRFSTESHWSQHQIVARTIEMIISDHSVTSNVICSGYDKYTQSSPLVELLTAPAWCLLLQRVGDEIMAYLLKNAWIFLPLVYKRYHQVAGSPISKLFFSMKKHKLESQSGPRKKRKGDDNVIPLSKKQGPVTTSSSEGVLSSFSCVCCYKYRSYHEEKHSQVSSSEAAMEMKTGLMVNVRDNSSQPVQQHSNQSLELLRKRSRPFRWQRSRKHKQFQGTAIAPCTRNMENKHWLPEKCDSENSACSYREKNLWKCCYLVREVPKKTTKEAQINRKLLFYNSETSLSVLPRNHILNSLKPNSSDSILLLESIFGLSGTLAGSSREPCYQNIGPSPSDTSVCLYHSLTKLLKILIRRAQNCQHLNLLNKHCVVPTYDQNEIESSEDSFKESESKNKVLKKSHDQSKNSLEANDPRAIKSYCLKSQVVSFVWAACRSIIPPELLGTPTNWRILRRNISKFIQLRKFERFSLKQCMHKLKTSAFPYFFNDHSLCLLSNQVLQHGEGQMLETSRSSELNEATYRIRNFFLESWIYWFFSYVVVPLLQANFYVTESECGKQDLFYYKKSVWEKVKKMATNCLKDQNYVDLDNATTRDIIKCRRFGFSKLRFLPKENRIRLLANLKAPSRMPQQETCWKNKSSRISKRMRLVQKTFGFHHFKSVNSVLRDTHSVLKGIQSKEPERLGSSVFDYNDVYRRLCSFLIQLKGGSSNIPGVFIIVSDVAKAFDSVEQKMLLSVIKDVIRDEKYTLKQSCEVCCTKSSLWVHDHYILLDQIIKSSATYLIPCQSTNSILLNQECSKTVMKSELLFDLNEHIKRNVLQLDKKFYLQRVGISQGSVLSTLLCSLYYGDMDKKVIFPFLERISQTAIQDGSKQHNWSYASGAQIYTSNIKYMLLRFIDDFLFVSTSKQQAEGFFSRLWRGFQDYNCYMNADKFSVNFDVGHIAKLPSNRLCIGEDGVSFIRWSGLLINCCTLEVQADYTKEKININTTARIYKVSYGCATTIITLLLIGL
ncbi:telomerase reverse transcriptase isoform X2 [Humulus lupulus]|uniref:telomerase reverse transcriptase isoform X2 n=1 Tax=Humulus lupulus TaxID=3486 RepID=UPI002B40243E|nr:telomerase reverse transcriptase isoform X2 [Humulus lupulus]